MQNICFRFQHNVDASSALDPLKGSLIIDNKANLYTLKQFAYNKMALEDSSALLIYVHCTMSTFSTRRKISIRYAISVILKTKNIPFYYLKIPSTAKLVCCT